LQISDGHWFDIVVLVFDVDVESTVEFVADDF
jgi:hypothetical protein